MRSDDREVLVAKDGVIVGYYLPMICASPAALSVLSPQEHADVIEFWWDHIAEPSRVERMLESEARRRGHVPWIDLSRRS